MPALSLLLMATTLSAAPAYVTGNANACTATSCAVSLTSTNGGNLILLDLFVLDSTSVISVTDTQLNTYTLIGSPQTWSPYHFVERLYYAKNIRGGADTTTVTLSGSRYMEVRLYEYSGLDTSSPLDVSATQRTGTSAIGTSGTLTTTNANDLLFGFFHSDDDVTNTAGAGFTGRIPSSGGLLGEDENVGSTGSYSATMSFSGSADYVAFLVAFKAASGGGGGPPSITSLSTTTGAVGTSVTITGTNFGSTQGSSTVTFNGTVAASTSWSATSIVAPVPSGATTGNVVVTVSGVSSNGASFTVTGGSSNGYTYSRAITISHTKVPNTDQINFPVLISGTYSYLATTANGGNVTNANGYDITFTSDAAGTNPLAYERESYSAATGQVNFWVKIPTLSHTTDTVIYMFYGNSSVTTDQSNKTAVWDANYKGVWHLPNGSTLSANDSTSNANNGTITGATATTGQIDGAGSFSGSSQWIDVGNGSSLQITGSTLTVEAWVKTSESNPSSYERILVKELPGDASPFVAYGFARYAGTNTVYWLVSSGSTLGGVSPTSSLPIGAWTHLVGTYDGSNLKLYFNGTLNSTAANSGNINSTTKDVVIGADTEIGGEFFNGSIDEVRISNTVRSADWIATEYNNQINPSAFYTIGPAGSGGGGTGPSISGILVSDTATTATVSWTTDVSAGSRVDYGTTTGYGRMSAIPLW